MRPSRSSAVAVVAAAAFIACSILGAERAYAGGCSECTTSADCVAIFGEPAFCVLWDEPQGCGEQLQYCCPGQNCDTFSGRPSCEPDGSCVVVEDIGAGEGEGEGEPAGEGEGEGEGEGDDNIDEDDFDGDPGAAECEQESPGDEEDGTEGPPASTTFVLACLGLVALAVYRR